MTIDGRPFQVGGVLPETFRFSSFSRDTEVWLPFGHDPFTARRVARPVRGMRVVGRLAAGVDLPRAQAELDAIGARLVAAHPGDNADMGLRAVRIQDQATERVRPAVMVLNGAVAFVLLIACGNVANLLFVRATGRQREMAVRAALGAGRRQLLEQLLTESVILGLCGGLGGLLVAMWGVELLSRAPLESGSAFSPFNPSLDAIGLNLSAMGFASMLSLAVGLAVGMLPAWQLARSGAGDALKESSPTGTAAPRRLRALGGLVVAQVSLAVILLTGALLTATSFVRLLDVNPGFAAPSVLTFDVNLPGSRYREPHQVAGFYDRLIARAAALPGVTGAGAVEFMPLTGQDGSTFIHVDGLAAPPPGQEPRAHYRSATPGYFPAMGIQLRGDARSRTQIVPAPNGPRWSTNDSRKLWPGGSAPVGGWRCRSSVGTTATVRRTSCPSSECARWWGSSRT